MIDEKLKEWATPRQIETIDAVNSCKTHKDAADSLGMSERNLYRTLEAIKKKAAKHGYSPDHDMSKTAAPGFGVKGTSTLYDDEDNVKIQWVKTDRYGDSGLTHEEIREEFIRSAKEHSPVYPKIEHKLENTGNAAEISIFDLHFGSLCWYPETGQNYDIKIAEQVFIKAVTSLISYISLFKPEYIVFPIGSDFFNVNSKLNMTVNNTPQDEDCRYQKTYVRGRIMAVKAIDMLATVAPVHVKIIPGNHDEERAFYLGDSLECWYRNCDNVEIDNSPAPRKYWCWGKCMVGFTHGHDEVKGTLPLIMATEERSLWAKASFCEWHTGHLHHRATKSYDYGTEQNGVRERILPSLAATDSWHKRKGYSGLRSAEAFIWNKNEGNIANFSYQP